MSHMQASGSAVNAQIESQKVAMSSGQQQMNTINYTAMQAASPVRTECILCPPKTMHDIFVNGNR